MTSFPHTYFTGRDLLMAYRMNTVTLPAERGYPFPLVAEETWGYKWFKWIETIELTSDPLLPRVPGAARLPECRGPGSRLNRGPEFSGRADLPVRLS